MPEGSRWWSPDHACSQIGAGMHSPATIHRKETYTRSSSFKISCPAVPLLSQAVMNFNQVLLPLSNEISRCSPLRPFILQRFMLMR
jgi:hypothetical protein